MMPSRAQVIAEDNGGKPPGGMPHRHQASYREPGPQAG